LAVISSQLPLKIVAIALCAMLLLSCKYDCKSAADHKGIWKLETFNRGTMDSTIAIPDVLQFGEGKMYQLNDNCKILHKEKPIGRVITGKRDYISGDEHISVRFGVDTYAQYIAR
jgi:hypothetical protein